MVDGESSGGFMLPDDGAEIGIGGCAGNLWQRG